MCRWKSWAGDQSLQSSCWCSECPWQVSFSCCPADGVGAEGQLLTSSAPECRHSRRSRCYRTQRQAGREWQPGRGTRCARQQRRRPWPSSSWRTWTRIGWEGSGQMRRPLRQRLGKLGGSLAGRMVWGWLGLEVGESTQDTMLGASRSGWIDRIGLHARRCSGGVRCKSVPQRSCRDSSYRKSEWVGGFLRGG